MQAFATRADVRPIPSLTCTHHPFTAYTVVSPHRPFPSLPHPIAPSPLCLTPSPLPLSASPHRPFPSPPCTFPFSATVVAELKATGEFEEMGRHVDEAEHSLEMHAPFLAHMCKE
ncbi:unnamed protein product [Closterium sp. NIES-53]